MAAWGAGGILLLLPLLAMQVTDEVRWNLFDFLFVGALVLGVGVAGEVAVRRMSGTAYRAAVAVALAGAFTLIWVNGAVGIIADEGDRANLMYSGVLALGLIVALIGRLRPGAMARAVIAMAIGQVLVAAIALTFDLGSAAASWPRDVIGLTGFFTVLWLVSAWLFRRAAREQVARVTS